MFLDNERNMIPRWRDVRTTAALGELNALQVTPRPKLPDDIYFPSKLIAWEQEPSLVHATELVTAGVLLGHEAEVVSAARFILSQDLRCAPSVANMARIALTKTFPAASVLTSIESNVKDINGASRIRIREIKRRLSFDQRNGLAWTDLAREYAILGQLEKSERAIRIALMLQPQNRFVLRSTARLLIHTGEIEQAHDLLRRRPVTLHDPWLLCVEISLASMIGKTSRFIKNGRQALEDMLFSNWHLTELASTMGTLELNAGARRRARKLFHKSLMQPTENAVAQAEWASRQITGLNYDSNRVATVISYEADTYERCKSEEWSKALDSCEKWLLDEPFSNVPSSIGSQLATSVLEDFAKGERFARAGLQANPKSTVLLNNLAVSLALQDKVSEAKTELSKINLEHEDDDTRITVTATQGLILCREGHMDEGRLKYQEAISEATTIRKARLSIFASLHLLREEIHAKSASGEKAIQIIKEASENSDPFVNAMAKMVKSKYLDQPKQSSLQLEKYGLSTAPNVVYVYKR